MGDRAIQLLRRRIEELDTGLLPVVSFEADNRLVHFASVMGSYVDTMMAAESGGQTVLDPADADEIVGDCRLLDDIARGEADLVTGPLHQERQHWIATGRHASPPEEARFIGALGAGPIPPSTKPFHLGLYSSTATRTGRSMWWTYLDLFRGSDLYPLPWHTWQIHSAGSVLEITSAREWTQFVQNYASSNAGLIYPDWRKVAKDYDGVHLTLRAIAATQGFNFAAARGITAAAYWDVESTLWLRWCFTSTELDEVTT